MTASTQVLRNHLGRIILERRADLNSESIANNVERKDVFSLLVRASEESNKLKLSDSELVSDDIGQ
jgi:hypothetical protein